MARKALLLAFVVLAIGFARDASGAPQKDRAGPSDLGTPVQERTVWTGMSHWLEKPKQKTKNPLQALKRFHALSAICRHAMLGDGCPTS